MRTIPKPVFGSARPIVAAPLVLNDAGPIRFIRGAIRNSPWIVIAATAHLLAITALSVMYVKTQQAQAPEKYAGVVLKQRPAVADDPLPAEKPPAILPRDAVPAPVGEKEGPVNFDDVVVPGADPGRQGDVVMCPNPLDQQGPESLDPNAPFNLPSGPPGGTSIGVGRIGHHSSGTPSAFLGRVAGAGGRGGHDGSGQDGGDGPGGGKKLGRDDLSVMAALRWLKNHQSPDGRWDAGGFDAQCKMNRCDGPGDSTFSPGVTGLSLLAFLGAGQTHQSGSCRETVKNGLKYLKDIQDSEGCFGPRTSQHFIYNHACAALAMTEAFGMTGSRVFKEPAQRGIGFVLKSRNPYLAWRYAYPADGDNDTSVTGWMVMALKSARMSGLEVEKQPIADAISWVDKMTEPEFGRTGYQQRGGPPARTNDNMAKFPANKSESLTAVGLTVRIFGGHDLKGDEMIGKGADLLVKCLPKWDVDQGTIDYYYWYYGSLAMFQVGGDRWHKWNEAMKTALLDHQRLEKDRCELGSWDPVDPWSGEGGRVYATAINCLTMEVYYRYPILGVRGEAK